VRVLGLLQRYGQHATSFQILEPSFHYWFDPDGDAVVAYVVARGYRIAAGPPVAAAERLSAVARRFVEDAAAAGLRVAFFGADGVLLTALRASAVPFDHVKIGEHADFDTQRWSIAGRERRSLRAQVHRARNHGVVVRRLLARDPRSLASLRAEVETVLERWLASRRMSVMRFLVDLQPFVFAEERRYYVAEHDGRAKAFLAAVPVYGQRGWFLEDVIRAPDAPNGTTELLIHEALCDARDAGDTMATLGLCPLAGIEAGPGPHATLRRALHACWRHLGFLYGFESLYQFKARLRPDAWTPQHLVTCGSPVGPRAFHAVLAAFAGGGLVAFAADTVSRLAARIPKRTWGGVLGLLAALLVPWTVLLALADGGRWFGDPSIQAAWVAFDATMALMLAALARAVAAGSRSARTGAAALLGATVTDALLTTVQALHLHRALTGWAAVFVTLGIAGPLLASALLALLLAALGAERRGFG
jgi:hypothetical protein